MLAVIVENADLANHIILYSHQRGCIFFWLLFELRAVRISPPLTITDEEIKKGCAMILEAIDAYKK